MITSLLELRGVRKAAASIADYLSKERKGRRGRKDPTASGQPKKEL
jgi:hypothetical protein